MLSMCRQRRKMEASEYVSVVLPRDAVPDSTSINSIRFYDRDVSAALNIRRIAAGPGRPREHSSWLGRPAMPNLGRPGQEWVQVRDKGLLRKWQRRHQRQR
ncbi:hypothetical protein QJQ45_027993 [Haematococcus lacustris]|nr:hypothetical protein QJQ45_027993 [Haematococcus lacustris]